MPPEGGWDWPEVRRSVRNKPELLHGAVWMDDRLCGLFVGWTGQGAFQIAALEGDPRADCPLKGCILLIILETCSCYAQRLGLRELRILEPANEKLISLYESSFGFRIVRKRNEPCYMVREV